MTQRSTESRTDDDEKESLTNTWQSGEEGLLSSFTEELVEKIMARIPCPHFFKTFLLSKKWHDKLVRPYGRREGLTPLQKEVTCVSTNWNTYCPVFFDIKEVRLQGFDRVSFRWKSIFSLLQLPFETWDSRIHICEHDTPDNYGFYPTCAGSLICVHDPSDNYLSPDCSLDCNEEYERRLLICNVVTRRWRVLRIPSKDELGVDRWELPTHVKLLPGEFGTFKLLLLFIIYGDSEHQVDPGDDDQVWIQSRIFDQRENEWSISYTRRFPYVVSLLENDAYIFPHSVYLHGIFYCILVRDVSGFPDWTLWIHHVDTDKVWIPIDPIPSTTIKTHETGGVFCCRGKIIVIAWYIIKSPLEEFVQILGEDFEIHMLMKIPPAVIYELDMDSLLLVEVSIGPPEELMSGEIHWSDFESCWRTHEPLFASDDDFIYFRQDQRHGPKSVVTYNVEKGEWGSVPPPDYASGASDNTIERAEAMFGSDFRPGLNPFATVD